MAGNLGRFGSIIFWAGTTIAAFMVAILVFSNFPWGLFMACFVFFAWAVFFKLVVFAFSESGDIATYSGEVDYKEMAEESLARIRSKSESNRIMQGGLNVPSTSRIIESSRERPSPRREDPEAEDNREYADMFRSL